MLTRILLKQTINSIDEIQNGFLSSPSSVDNYNTLVLNKIHLINDLLNNRNIQDDIIFNEVDKILQVHEDINTSFNEELF